VILIDVILNLILLFLYYLLRLNVSEDILSLSGFVEFLLCFLSLIFIAYVLIKKIKKIQLVLPIFFIVFFFTGYVDSHFVMAQGINVMDVRNIHNLIGTIIELIGYLFILIFSIHLLKKKEIRP
jgi:hypothetical protein